MLGDTSALRLNARTNTQEKKPHTCGCAVPMESMESASWSNAAFPRVSWPLDCAMWEWHFPGLTCSSLFRTTFMVSSFQWYFWSDLKTSARCLRLTCFSSADSMWCRKPQYLHENLLHLETKATNLRLSSAALLVRTFLRTSYWNGVSLKPSINL